MNSPGASAQIHPSAIVHPGARLGAGVKLGPFAVIGDGVELGAGCDIRSHAVLEGPTVLGRDNLVYPFASIGSAPQDLKYRGEPTTLHIGDGNQFREFVTINRGTQGGGGDTTIGHENLFMAYVHVAHDCHVGNRTVFANNATVAGHVTIGDFAILSGLAAVGQFVRVGEGAFLGAGAMVSLDVAPFCMAQGDRAKLIGLNSVGLERRGVPAERIEALERAYRLVFREGHGLDEALLRLEALELQTPEITQLVQFLRKCERGLTR